MAQLAANLPARSSNPSPTWSTIFENCLTGAPVASMCSVCQTAALAISSNLFRVKSRVPATPELRNCPLLLGACLSFVKSFATAYSSFAASARAWVSLIWLSLPTPAKGAIKSCALSLKSLLIPLAAKDAMAQSQLRQSLILSMVRVTS